LVPGEFRPHSRAGQVAELLVVPVDGGRRAGANVQMERPARFALGGRHVKIRSLGIWLRQKSHLEALPLLGNTLCGLTQMES